MLGTQRGWFAQFDGKGVEFPLFLQTTLADFGRHHGAALLRDLSKVDLASLLGSVALDLIANSPDPDDRLTALCRNADKPEAKMKIIGALKNVHSKAVSAFLREEYQSSSEVRMRAAILQSLTAQPIEPVNLPLLVEGLRHEDPDVVRGCASAVIQYKPELDDPLANVLLSRLAERRSLFYTLDNTLVVLSGQKHPGFKPDPASGERLEEPTRAAAIEFWKSWYAEKFGKKFEPMIMAVQRERSDEELHRFILGADLKAGSAERGAQVYEKVGCNNCHRGGVTPGREGRLFGPDLTDVTRRLTRPDLADAIVYPSKQVADRFKAFEVSLKDGISITGFITEQDSEFVTFADREQVHRLARSAIQAISPQSASLMPGRLLNNLTDEDVRDLLTFLE
jgi:putative heme-binding domain-containing protein